MVVYHLYMIVSYSGMSDKYLIISDIIILRKLLVNILHEYPVKISSVLLAEIHGAVSIVYLYTRLQLQKICTKHGKRRASSAGTKIIQFIYDKAGMDLRDHSFELFSDLSRFHSLFYHI